MSVNDVLADYDRIRVQNSIEEKRRLEQVYKKAPAIKEIHEKIKSLQKQRIRRALSDDKAISLNITMLRNNIKDLLVLEGFDPGYLDPIYTCPVCRDTGIKNNSTRCDCFKKKLLDDKLREVSLRDDNISFENFDLNVFSEKPVENGKSQKDQMHYYKGIFESYANDVPYSVPFFLISGSTGLGKTYMAKCIMRRVIERGFSAAFYTAYNLFSLFHKERLGENVDLSALFEVPLLIIDDLGTEPMTRNVTKEYFFDLINERSGQNTIIVTNLPFDRIKERYGDRIHSRLMDIKNSKKILFRGDDIRY